MPLDFIVTETDMLRSKVLDPGWYKVTVVRVYQEPSAAGDSTNTWIEFRVDGGPAQKDNTSAVKTPVKRCFSEKAPGFIVPFLKACGAQVGPQGGKFNVENCKDKQIMAYNEVKMYEGKPQNNFTDFRPVTD